MRLTSDGSISEVQLIKQLFGVDDDQLKEMLRRLEDEQ